MLRSGSSNNVNSESDFELPGEILNALPTDPYEQLDLARKITSIAVGTRVSKLEAEAVKLRHKISERDQVIHSLNDKIGHLERKLSETNEKLSHAFLEQAKLTNEKSALTATVKKLNRDVAKLELFKKTLIQSLKEEDDTSQADSTQSTDAQRQANVKASLRTYSKDEDSNILTGGENLESNAFLETGGSVEDENRGGAHGLRRNTYKLPSLTMPNITPPQISPTGSPNEISPTHSPRQHSTRSPKGPSPTHSPNSYSASAPARHHSISPSRRQFEGRVSTYSSLPASSHATAPNSPPHSGSHSGRLQRMDGKEFFRQARSRLSFEQFSAFLANIKELNSQHQTREETLRKADEIFGSDNKDLYVIFDGLLSRHLH
ncbi:hypothetical protein SUGI_0908070 [Cryptomeria japonica]|uniref:uncharacterized protein At4g15545 isoform X2 n=1 Tax=Cryptomeria japonica TaxID=3369 RepID=UPI002414B59C|nr:uncharacterized protein At4g15545 isoform X2 [Cryptomeria japonica]GLJ43624.1 hypothetical protein SUGI_0908070 [Cryptomeria japonica]